MSDFFHISPLRGISDRVITDFLKNCGISPKYIGVYCCHHLADLSRTSVVTRSTSFILILNVRSSHWVTIYKLPDYILYVDSFGQPASDERTRSFLFALGAPVFYNEKIIQHPTSSFCGMYACLWALIFDSKIKENPIFSTHLLSNDKLCMKILKKYIDKMR